METAGVPVSSGAGEGVFGAGRARPPPKPGLDPGPAEVFEPSKNGGGPPGTVLGSGAGLKISKLLIQNNT